MDLLTQPHFLHVPLNGSKRRSNVKRIASYAGTVTKIIGAITMVLGACYWLFATQFVSKEAAAKDFVTKQEFEPLQRNVKEMHDYLLYGKRPRIEARGDSQSSEVRP